jgi:hypothetical protein
MKSFAIVLIVMLLAGCSGMGMDDMSASRRAARNLCESMRSWDPYRPNQCGEQSMGAQPSSVTR